VLGLQTAEVETSQKEVGLAEDGCQGMGNWCCLMGCSEPEARQQQNPETYRNKHSEKVVAGSEKSAALSLDEALAEGFVLVAVEVPTAAKTETRSVVNKADSGEQNLD
jgi:hypothetical protein